MGYTSGHTPMFSSDMKQTPDAVAKVLDVAGWTVLEASHAMDINPVSLLHVVERDKPLPDDQWERLLDVCGKRAFDWGCDDCE